MKSSNRPIGLFPKPILFDIRKDGIYAKEIGSNITYNGVLFSWYIKTKKNTIKVLDVGEEYKVNEKIKETDCIKTVVFFEENNQLISDFEIAVQSLKKFILGTLLSKMYLFNPVIVVNCPYNLSKNDIVNLQEIFLMVGVRDYILIKSESIPDERLIKAGVKIPYEIIDGENSFVSNKKVLIVGILLILGLFLLKILLMAIR